MKNSSPVRATTKTDEAEIERNAAKTRLLSRLQWSLNWASLALTIIGVGLYFADLRVAAQVILVLLLLIMIASGGLAYYRYRRNLEKREQIYATLDAEREAQLREIFDGARKERNLPPDAEDAHGFTAEVNAGRERIARAEQAANAGRRPKGNKNGRR